MSGDDKEITFYEKIAVQLLTFYSNYKIGTISL